MSRCSLTRCALACALPFGIARHAQAQDAIAGEKLFRIDCSICHSPHPGRNLVGPSLFNVVNRHSGEVPNFHYSEANPELWSHVDCFGTGSLSDRST
jgi:cytochrome c2